MQPTPEVARLVDRYHRYLDALFEHNGDKVQALADVFGLSDEAAAENFADLLAEVKSGQGHSEISDILEQNDLSVHAQVRAVRRWAYSPNAAASLNAIKLVKELGGENEGVGDFEKYLRLAKERDRLHGGKKA
jgi:hypothetical protein